MSGDKKFLISDASALRLMRPEDHAFVVNSWLKSHKECNFRKANGKDFFACHAPVVRKLIAESTIKLVACDPEDIDLIQSWIVADVRGDNIPVVHYLYTKDIYRHLGIATALFKSATSGSQRVACTHLGHAYDDVKHKFQDVVEIFYDPHSIITREK